MADEIKLTTRLSCTNGSFKADFNPSQFSIDQAAIGANSGVVEVGTSEEVLSFTDISTEGILILHNLDATNYVEYGPEDSGSMVALGKIKPGEPTVLRLTPSVVLRLQANTAACKVYYLLLED